jgi:hypothetical protein
MQPYKTAPLCITQSPIIVAVPPLTTLSVIAAVPPLTILLIVAAAINLIYLADTSCTLSTSVAGQQCSVPDLPLPSEMKHYWDICKGEMH